MKKRRGRPALGRTRKLTKGVTVKFSPVSYETLRFRAGKSGRSLAVYIREAALAATVTARHTPEENALLLPAGKLKRIMDDYRPKGG